MKAKADFPTAIVLGLSPTGLHVVRTIRRLGVRVIGIGHPGEVGFASRYLSDRILDVGAGDCLDKAAKLVGPGPAVLLPTSDEYVELISDGCDPRWIFQESYKSGLSDLLLTKVDFYRKCSELRLGFPRSTTISTLKSRDQLSDLSLPVILKPSRMHDHKSIMRGIKGWIIGDERDLDRHWSQIAAFPGDIVAQEFIPGPESEIRLVCGTMRADGEVTSLFTARKLRQFPRGIGSASVVQSASEPEAAQMAVTFLRSIGYQGIFGAEIKKHALTRALNFIEINPRTSLWFSVSEAAGCSIVQQSYLDLVAPDRPLQRHTQMQGVRWRYCLKDLATCASYALWPHKVFPRPDMSDAGSVKRRVWAVYETKDARPALQEPLLFVRKTFSRLVGKARM